MTLQSGAGGKETQVDNAEGNQGAIAANVAYPETGAMV